jgi:hypothetical protein
MTHVEVANDVVHLHNIGNVIKSPPPPYNTGLRNKVPLVPNREAKVSLSLDEHVPQLRFQRFPILLVLIRNS